MRQVHAAALALMTMGLATVAGAETLYVPTIHALQGDGSYRDSPLKGSEQGVPLAECQSRAKRWKSKNAQAIALAQESLGGARRDAAIEVSCDKR
ncbi:hypothetical protein [Salipiger sp.]|uniref:hypothetical protein n=1 Tax=Salipiger sp. TaxID=2078585 RepID=UPI003A97A019